MQSKKNLIATIGACTCAIALGTCLLTGCAPKSASQSTAGTGTQSASTGAVAATDYTTGIDASAIPAVATEADVQKYCENCHFKSDIDSWSKNNVDAAIVDSMLFPTFSTGNNKDVEQKLDDSLAAYWADKEPKQTGMMQ